MGVFSGIGRIRTFLGPQATAERREEKTKRQAINVDLNIEKEKTKQILAETGSNLGGTLGSIFGGPFGEDGPFNKGDQGEGGALADPGASGEVAPGFLDDPLNQGMLAVAAGAVLWKMSQRK